MIPTSFYSISSSVTSSLEVLSFMLAFVTNAQHPSNPSMSQSSSKMLYAFCNIVSTARTCQPASAMAGTPPPTISVGLPNVSSKSPDIILVQTRNILPNYLHSSGFGQNALELGADAEID